MDKRGVFAVVHAFRFWNGAVDAPELVALSSELFLLMESFGLKQYERFVDPWGVGRKGIVHRVSFYFYYTNSHEVYPVPPDWRKLFFLAERMGWHVVFLPWEAWVDGNVFLTPAQSVLSRLGKVSGG